MNARSILPLVLGLSLPLQASGDKLIDLVPGLYGGDGIVLATLPAASHTAHFSIESAAGINRLNQQIAAEVGGFPVSSAIGGFSFEFDPVTGEFVTTTRSLGPLVGERATTQGKGRFNTNLSLTFLEYSEFGGNDLSDFEVIALHDPDIVGFPDTYEQFEQDRIRIAMDLDISVQIVALSATYGISEDLDVGVLLPYAAVDLDVRSRAEVVRGADNTLFPDIHTFEGGEEPADDRVRGDASGLGDLMLRAKHHLVERGGWQVAGAAQVQFATGDDEDFLGTGDTTVRPFVVLSKPIGAITPHANVGYEFNLDRSEHSAVEYAVGFDAGSSRYTVAGELLGSHELDGDGIGDDVVDAAVGLKWKAPRGLLLGVNARLPVNDAGLRSAFISTVSLEYGF